MITNNGFKIIAIREHRFKRAEARNFYKHHDGKDFFKELVKFTCSKKVVVALLEKENAIESYRKLLGATNPINAEEGTIRNFYGTPNGGHLNAAHGSDSNENAHKETLMFFPEKSYLWEE